MTKRRFHFDRISQYRVAVFLLMSPIAIVWAHDWFPMELVRALYWSGTALVAWAVISDWVVIYKRRRDIDKMIIQAKTKDAWEKR
jgi:hypothetical protein